VGCCQNVAGAAHAHHCAQRAYSTARLAYIRIGSMRLARDRNTAPAMCHVDRRASSWRGAPQLGPFCRDHSLPPRRWSPTNSNKQNVLNAWHPVIFGVLRHLPLRGSLCYDDCFKLGRREREERERERERERTHTGELYHASLNPTAAVTSMPRANIPLSRR